MNIGILIESGKYTKAAQQFLKGRLRGELYSQSLILFE